jgi:hypothetical protein
MILGIAESYDLDGLCPLYRFALLRGLRDSHVVISTGFTEKSRLSREYIRRSKKDRSDYGKFLIESKAI